MFTSVLVLIGYAFYLSQAATIVSLPLVTNSTLDAPRFGNESLLSGYVKLHPGAKIYFYTTEDENLLIGPKLQSEDEVRIYILDEDEEFKKSSFSKGTFIKPETYYVVKSGVLVPKRREPGTGLEECNKCVYQSLKPTYYIKGFKNILIPVDVLYSKNKQKNLFKNLESKTLLEPDSWRTDLSVANLDQSHSDEETSDALGKNSSWVSWSLGKKILAHGSPLNVVDSMPKKPREATADDILPDKTCDGEVTLFVLKKNGIFKRMPSDPFLPPGMRLSYSLLRNLMFKPKFLGGSNMVVSYLTGKNGDLIPHSDNLHKVVADEGGSVSFMLSKNGGMFPVKEEKGANKSISYYFNGNLVHKSSQFTETFSNSTSLLINNKKFQIFQSVEDGMKFEPVDASEKKKNRSHHLQKREAFFRGYDKRGGLSAKSGHAMAAPIRVTRQPNSVDRQVMDFAVPYTRGSGRQLPPEPLSPPPAETRSNEMISAKALFTPNPRGRMCHPPGDRVELEEAPVESVWEGPPLRPRTDIFIFDEKGTRVRLIPEITETNDVVIYKLTCKGNLVRYPPCKEPEYNFPIHFQLLLDEFVLVPAMTNKKPYHLTFILQENGDLVPSEDNVNTFRKAPGSLIYYMLGKNNVLFPVQQVIDMEGYVSFFYQDFFLLKMRDSTEKPLHFCTKGTPLFAFFNGFTMITISSKPRLNSSRGSNWLQLKPTSSAEGPLKSMYLTGPKGELIKVAPYKNKLGSTVIYELDCNGIFYRSPKDKKKCIILRSFMLLKEGILLPSNDTTGYVYMMSKNGDLFPYLYPEGKIEAPLASSLKYVLCEKGILLPIKLEVVGNHICYMFRDVVLYKERIFCKSCLDRLDEEQLDLKKNSKKGSCDVLKGDKNEDMKLFINKDGDYVFYERRGILFKRCPPEQVPPYLKFTMGSFEVKPDGSLTQIRYQDPNEHVINLMLEPNGDLLEDTRNTNKVRSTHYVLDSKGNLISVEGRKTKKHLYFYKGSVRVCRVPIPDWEAMKLEHEPAPVVEESENLSPGKELPLGKDPLGLMEDVPPAKNEPHDEARPFYVPIPLKSMTIADPSEHETETGGEEYKKKCEMLKETLKHVTKTTSLPLALELELTDEVLEELKNWASRCDKVLSRRDISEDLRNYIQNLNYVGAEGGKV